MDLKNIYAKQLPNMPKDYIVRLVFDRGHKSLIAVKARLLVALSCRVAPADAAAQSGVIVGGITYRLFGRQQLAEIAFCAVSAVEQVKGYGTRLMDKLKGYVTKEEGCTHLITFADNNAVGYFQKQARVVCRTLAPLREPALRFAADLARAAQGFSKEILMEREKWAGYIKARAQPQRSLWLSTWSDWLACVCRSTMAAH